MPNFLAPITIRTPAAAPTAPATGEIKIYPESVAGRQMLTMMGPSGMDVNLQPGFARNKIGLWLPPGNATTVPGVFGMSALTATGTATARNVATTNMATRMRRLGYVSAATAAAFAGVRHPSAQYTVGAGGSPSLGGFTFIERFFVSDAATVSGARMFVGMTSSVAAPTNVEPSTLTNSIGVGQLSSSTNLQIVYGGSSAQTPIDLGANFPANTLSADVYELALFARPDISNEVGIMVTRLNTGHTYSGTLTGTTGVALPAATTLLGFQSWRTNNATLLAVGLDICSIYIETDY